MTSEPEFKPHTDKRRIEYPCSEAGWAVRREFQRLPDEFPRQKFREPVKLGNKVHAIAETCMKELGGSPDQLISKRISDTWNAIVGDAIAAHASPAGFQGGILQIRVSSPVWLAELRRSQRLILANLNRALSGDTRSAPRMVVRQLRFSVEYAPARPAPPHD